MDVGKKDRKGVKMKTNKLFCLLLLMLIALYSPAHAQDVKAPAYPIVKDIKFKDIKEDKDTMDFLKGEWIEMDQMGATEGHEYAEEAPEHKDRLLIYRFEDDGTLIQVYEDKLSELNDDNNTKLMKEAGIFRYKATKDKIYLSVKADKQKPYTTFMSWRKETDSIITLTQTVYGDDIEARYMRYVEDDYLAQGAQSNAQDIPYNEIQEDQESRDFLIGTWEQDEKTGYVARNDIQTVNGKSVGPFTLTLQPDGKVLQSYGEVGYDELLDALGEPGEHSTAFTHMFKVTKDAIVFRIAEEASDFEYIESLAWEKIDDNTILLPTNEKKGGEDLIFHRKVDNKAC